MAFVAQSVGMDYVGPYTFLCMRSILGGAVLIPVMLFTRRYRASHPAEAAQALPDRSPREERKMALIAGLVCGAIYFLASIFQQISLLTTTVGKAGFLTTCYILIVPILNYFLWRKKVGLNLFLGIVIAVVGLYYLSIQGAFTIAPGDLLCLAGAFMFAAHIIAIDYFVLRVESVTIACLQFWVATVLSGVCMFLFETPRWTEICGAMGAIAYAGIMSSGVAFTLQIIGQKGMNPTIASLIMSLEAVISALAGWLLLRESLSTRELVGCALMLVAVVLAQLPGKTKAKAAASTDDGT